LNARDSPDQSDTGGPLARKIQYADEHAFHSHCTGDRLRLLPEGGEGAGLVDNLLGEIIFFFQVPGVALTQFRLLLLLQDDLIDDGDICHRQLSLAVVQRGVGREAEVHGSPWSRESPGNGSRREGHRARSSRSSRSSRRRTSPHCELGSWGVAARLRLLECLCPHV
jgi:hypothetical protein